MKLLKPRSTTREISEPEPIEVTRGEVRIGKELTKLQILLKEWFYTCLATGITVLFVCQLLLILAFKLILNARSHQTNEDESPSVALNLEGSFIDGSEAEPDDLPGQQVGCLLQWNTKP